MNSDKKRSAKEKIKIFLKRLLFVIWASGLLSVIVSSLIPQAFIEETDTIFGRDKFVRLAVFACLAFYPAAFFTSIKKGLIIASLVAPIGFMLEIIQKHVPGRNFSAYDMIANNAGAVIGIIAALTVRFLINAIRFRAASSLTTELSGTRGGRN